MTEATDSPIESYQPYVVRLIMTVPARSPEEAVARFIEELTSKGMRNWVYGVLDANTGETVAELNGWGDDQTELIERLTAEAQAENGAEPPAEQPEAPVAPTTPTIADDEDDEDLTRLAEGLNAGQ